MATGDVKLDPATKAAADTEGKSTETLTAAGKPDPVVNSTAYSSTDVSSLSGNNTTGQVSDTEKKIRRAERFGISVQLSEQEKRYSRAERFGTASTPMENDPSKKLEDLKRKARAERFGLATPVDGEAKKKDDEAKKKGRLERFGQAPKTDAAEEEKRKARLARFSQPPSGSVSINGKGNIEPKAAIASKEGGGS